MHVTRREKGFIRVISSPPSRIALNLNGPLSTSQNMISKDGSLEGILGVVLFAGLLVLRNPPWSAVPWLRLLELVPWNGFAPGGHPQRLAPVLGLGSSLDL